MSSRFSRQEAQQLQLLLGIKYDNPEEAEQILRKTTAELQKNEGILEKARKRAKEIRKEYKESSDEIKKLSALRSQILKSTKDEQTRLKQIAAIDGEIARQKQQQQQTNNDRVRTETVIRQELAKQGEYQRIINTLLAEGNHELEIAQQIQQKISRGTELAGTQARFFGDVEGRFRALTGAVGYVGGTGLEQKANIAAEVLASVEAIGLLKQEFPQMAAAARGFLRDAGTFNVVMLAAAAAIAATAVAATLLDENAQKGADHVKALAESMKTYFEAIATGTSTDIRDQIKDGEQSLSVLRQQLAILKDADDQMSSVLGGIPYWAQGITDSYLGTSYGAEELKSRIKELESEIRETELTSGLLTSALSSAAVQARDLAEAEKELMETRRDEADAIISDLDSALQEQARREVELETIMPEDAAAAVREAQADFDRMTILLAELDKMLELGLIDTEYYTAKHYELLESFYAARETLEYYNTTATEAATANQFLANVLTFTKDSMGALTDSVSDFADWSEKASKAAEKAAADAQKFWSSFAKAADEHQRAIAESQMDYATAVQREIMDFERDMVNRAIDHSIELSRMDQDYYEKRADVLQKLGGDEEKQRKEELDKLAKHQLDMARLAEDHRLKMMQIQRDMNVGVEAAVEDRNVSAAIEAVRTAKEEARREEEQYELERKRREEDFKLQVEEMTKQREEKKRDYQQQLQDLRQNHERQRQERIQDFNREQARRQQEFAIRRQREEEDFNQRIQRMRDQFMRQWGMTSDHYAYLNQLTSYGMARVENTMIIAWDSIIKSLQRTSSMAVGTSSLGGGIAGGINTALGSLGSFFSGFAEGGSPMPGQIVKVGERGPEWVTFGSQAQVWPNGINPMAPMTFNANGYNPADARLIEEVFKQRIIPSVVRAVRNRRN